MIDTKLLRQKILDLAIRGKLVPQNPADEPASELLKKIKAEKDALVKAGKIKKDKHESCIFKGDDNRYYETIDSKTADITDEIPFDLPSNWCWSRIETALFLQAGKFISANEIHEVADEKHRYPCYGGNGKRGFVDRFNTYGKHPIIGRQGALCGNINFASGDFYATEHAVVVDVFAKCSSELIALFLTALNLNQYSTATAQPGLSVNVINSLLLPIPPLAEQQRIVAQIETLLGYVDIIDTDAETLEKSITLAKRKILDLAIRGKLVSQDPADEPASELLKKIKAEKEALIKAGKLKKDKHESYIFKSDDNCYHENIDGKVTNITDEIPFDLPDSWTWSRIENIGVLNPRNKIEDDTEVSFMPMAQLEAGFGSKYTLSEKKWKEVKSGFTHFAENDIVFAKITPCFQNRKSAVMRGLKNGYGAGTTELHVLRSNSYLIVPEYALLFVKTQSFITDAVATIQGVVGQQRIDAGFVKHYLFPIPPLAEQKRIVSQVEKLFSVLETMRG